ncbi:MAG TPA: tetratricopeptide repeat protein, partial [Thermoanaerobaculia bacterium]|nr:tetratricopeptide repeat protein [Thermoanaerobaculia bacterium]
MARSRLPYALTPLLGRARELEETTRLLDGTRILTITGAGGSGKTRLAQELAHRVRDEYDDVAWVELAPLSDPDLIGQQILDAVGVRELAAEDVLRVVTDSIRELRMLLVLDNCEHLVDAVAVVAEEILRSCPNTTILTTTREALGIRGEQTWLVPPLSIEDAVQLFTERARLVAPSFTPDATVEQICRRLDGIPLAIELAAARVKVLTVAEIAARLDDAFRLLSSGSRTLPRHRTIRETIDWSYRLLSPDEQVLLRRLAVFATGFTLDDAEAICGDIDVLTHLSALVDKSLVIAEGSRYRLLDTVRQFAAEKLTAAGEDAELRTRHAEHFLSLVESLEPRLFAGAVDPSALAQIDQEIGNIRAVFDSGVASEIELRLLYALHWYWFARAHFHEARRRITHALARAGNVDEVVLAKARVAAATAAVWQGDWAAVRPLVDPAIEVLRGTSELRPLANALMLQASAYAFANDHATAIEIFEDAEAVARRNGRDVALALTLYWKATTAQLRGDWRTARTAFEEAHEIGLASGNKPAIAHPLTGLGFVEMHDGKRDAAIRCFRTALDIHAEL